MSTAAPTRAAFGTWVFLASEWLFFGTLLLAYAQARWAAPAGFAEAGRHTDVVLGTVNTALLLTSSAMAAAAVHTVERGRRTATVRWLAATAVLGLLFLAVKAVEYHREWREGLFPAATFALATVPGARHFFGLYWMMTGVHALHLGAGIGVFSALAWQLRHTDAAPMAPRIEAATLYWHFVDIVWIVLYPLLYLAGRAP